MDAEFSEDDIKRAQTDPEQMSKLLERTRRWFVGIAYSVVGNAQAAEDVVQEAWMRIARHLGTLQDYKYFKAWSYRIVKNVALSYSRRQSLDNKMKALESEKDSPIIMPFDPIRDEEDAQSVIRNIDQLPKIYKEVLLLKHVQELTYAEMACRTGYSVKTLEVRLVRARKLLSKRVGIVLNRGRRRDPVRM